jgi:hypothetical protein
MGKLFISILFIALIGCKYHSNSNKALIIQPLHLSNKHQCRWPLCPYKGIDTTKAAQSVANYVGETGIDAYYIDLYHIKYPNYDYETLDSLLTR